MFKLFAALAVLGISGATVFAQGPAPLSVTVQPQSTFDKGPYLADGIVATFTASMPPFPFGGSQAGWYGTNGKAEIWIYQGGKQLTVRAAGSCETAAVSDAGTFKLAQVHSVGGCPKGLETFQVLILR